MCSITSSGGCDGVDADATRIDAREMRLRRRAEVMRRRIVDQRHGLIATGMKHRLSFGRDAEVRPLRRVRDSLGRHLAEQRENGRLRHAIAHGAEGRHVRQRRRDEGERQVAC